MTASPAQAVYTYWTGAVSNSWTDPANWSNGVPGLADTTAVIGGSPFVSPVINVPGITGYLIRIGDTTAGTPTALSGELTINGGGTLELNRYMAVAYSNNTTGTLTVTGTGSALIITATNGGLFFVALGDNSLGTVNISNNASVQVAETLGIAGGVGSTGTVTMTGLSTMTVGNSFSVGDSGQGNLTVSDGSIVRSGTNSPPLIVGPIAGVVTPTDGIGASTGSVGITTVTGAGSILTSSNPLVVGGANPALIPFYLANYGFDAAGLFGGQGSLIISNGGAVSSGVGGHADPGFINVTYIGGTPGSTGTATVTDQGSSWTIGGDLFLGGDGRGALTIANSGQVSAQSVVVAQNTGSSGTLNIGAAAGQAAVAPGTLNTPTLQFGVGIGNIVFNHTDTSGNYVFAPRITGVTSTSSVDVYAGTTVMTGMSDYFGTTTIHGGTLAAGAARVFSQNSDYLVQAGGILDLNAHPQTVASLANAGNVIINSDPGNVLTVTGAYISNRGNLSLSTVLGTDTSPTDQLHAGSVVLGSGATNVFVTNAGGPGALTTGDGIEIVRVAGASAADAFQLGTRVAAGAYEYLLYQGGVDGNDSNGNWYLRSTLSLNGQVGPSLPDENNIIQIPNFRPEVATNIVVPALAGKFGLTMLGTYHDRVGQEYGMVQPVQTDVPICRDPKIARTVRCATLPKNYASETTNMAGWGRIFGETGNVGFGGRNALARFDKFEKNGPSYDYDLAGFQVGMDLLRRVKTDGSSDVAGLYVGAGRIDSDVKNSLGSKAGSTSMDGYSFGAYWTLKGGSGWYLDAVVQATRYSDISSNSVKGQNMQTEGWGMASSLEGGYPIVLGTGWNLEPQAQIIYQHLAFDDSSDAYGRITYNDSNTAYGRIGGRLTKDWTIANNRVITTWARANLWHTFGDNAKTTFASLGGTNPLAFSTKLGGTWAQLGLGISGQVAHNVSLFATGDYNVSLDSGNGHGFGGHLGVKVVW